jgi:DNA-binding response OmpR family regulator
MEILIVEDKFEISRLIQFSLEDEGFSCDSWRRAGEAVIKCKLNGLV